MIDKQSLNLRCHSGNGEEGMDMRDLVEVEFIGLGTWMLTFQEKGRNQRLLQSLESG